MGCAPSANLKIERQDTFEEAKEKVHEIRAAALAAQMHKRRLSKAPLSGRVSNSTSKKTLHGIPSV